MASAKKKLDEYHLKILRQLVTQHMNKECFDCHQRGPTYVNVTIGSFVCTSCSGMLRGLTPPHRVKSISMATFTPEEVDFVKARGNDYCRKTWLGLLDNEPPTKDEQQIKDFMVAKYEKKRYYLDPALALAINNAVNGGSPSSSKPSTPSAPSKKVQTIPALPHPTSLSLTKPIPQTTSTNQFTPEPFADFSKLEIPSPCDPFSSQLATATAQPSFANFDNNPVFNNSSSSGMPVAGGEDRYAALKDLDSLMKSQQAVEQPPNEWNAGMTNGGMTSVWSAPSLTTSQPNDGIVSNPFKAGGAWKNVDNIGANPFRNNRPVTDSVWPNMVNDQGTNCFATSQSLNFVLPNGLPTNKVISNPFVIGNGHHSSNPFL